MGLRLSARTPTLCERSPKVRLPEAFSLEATRAQLRRCAALAILAALAGCAGLPNQYGFADIERLAAERLGAEIRWEGDNGEDGETAKAVRKLLSGPLTAEAAVQIALLNSHALQATYEKLGIARADLIQAGLLRNPVLSGSAAFGPSIEWEAALLEDLLNVLTLAARRRAAEAGFEQTKLEVASRIFDLAAEVRSAYYALVGDMQALGLLRTAAQGSEAAAALAERQVEAGTLGRLEQSMHQVLYAQTLLELSRAEAASRRDRERLNRLLGLWGGAIQWKTPERLPEVPTSLPEFAHLEAQAVEHSLLLAAAKREVEAFSTTRQAALRFRWLGLLGIGIATHREPDGQFTGPRVELGLPIFDRGQARLARLEAELRQSEQRLVALAVDLRAELRAARDRLVSAHEQARYLRRVLLPLQDTIRAETQRQYNGMLLGAYDLLSAKHNEINTARDYVAAVREFWLAWSDLERVLGERLAVPPAHASGLDDNAELGTEANSASSKPR
ncbi:MAG: TolC family protein [Gammaproteobacteria bacterium]